MTTFFRAQVFIMDSAPPGDGEWTEGDLVAGLDGTGVWMYDGAAWQKQSSTGGPSNGFVIAMATAL